MKTSFICCLFVCLGCGAAFGQAIPKAKPKPALPRTCDYISEKFTLCEPPEPDVRLEQHHLEAWVAEIKAHYSALQAFAKVEDLRDCNGNVLEWRPPMTTFSR